MVQILGGHWIAQLCPCTCLIHNAPLTTLSLAWSFAGAAMTGGWARVVNAKAPLGTPTHREIVISLQEGKEEFW